MMHISQTANTRYSINLWIIMDYKFCVGESYFPMGINVIINLIHDKRQIQIIRESSLNVWIANDTDTVSELFTFKKSTIPTDIPRVISQNNRSIAASELIVDSTIYVITRTYMLVK